MKNFLPKSNSSSKGLVLSERSESEGLTLSEQSESKGFTLIELMVVISIIAFLAVIGVAAYSNAQKLARDGRRKADIDAIAQAMESNYNATAGGYLTLAGPMFASGVAPVDPGSYTYTTITASYPTGCTGTATAPVCRAFSTCAQMETATGNSTNGTISWATGSPDTMSITNAGTGYYCRLSQQSI